MLDLFINHELFERFQIIFSLKYHAFYLLVFSHDLSDR